MNNLLELFHYVRNMNEDFLFYILSDKFIPVVAVIIQFITLILLPFLGFSFSNEFL